MLPSSLIPNLDKWRIILASASPRRHELLTALDIPFETRLLPDIDETYPHDLPIHAIAEYISQKKSAAYTLKPDELLITADTIVVLGAEVLGKPRDADDARAMLSRLAGQTHQVITGCCLRTTTRSQHFSVISDVTFAPLTADDISYYVSHYSPLDKAGAYGVQEWIGCVAVTNIKGSYFNVMGLPVQRLYASLRSFIASHPAPSASVT